MNLGENRNKKLCWFTNSRLCLNIQELMLWCFKMHFAEFSHSSICTSSKKTSSRFCFFFLNCDDCAFRERLCVGGSECVRGVCVCVCQRLHNCWRCTRMWGDGEVTVVCSGRPAGSTHEPSVLVENKRLEAEIPFIGNFNSYSMFYILQ